VERASHETLSQPTLFTPILLQLLSEHVLKQKFKPNLNMPKNALFLMKNCKNRQAGLLASGNFFAPRPPQQTNFAISKDVVASLDKAHYDDYLCLVASNKQ